MDVLLERFINSEENYVPLMIINQLIPFLNLWILVAYILSAAVDDNPGVFDPTLVGILTQFLSFQCQELGSTGPQRHYYRVPLWADRTQHCSHSTRL
jgi:hypothetical protein